MKKPIELETAKLANKKRMSWVPSDFAYMQGKLIDKRKSNSDSTMWHAPYQMDVVDCLREKHNIHISSHYSMYEQDGKLHREHSAMVSNFNQIDSIQALNDITVYHPKQELVKSFESHEHALELAIIEGLKMIADGK